MHAQFTIIHVYWVSNLYPWHMIWNFLSSFNWCHIIFNQPDTTFFKQTQILSSFDDISCNFVANSIKSFMIFMCGGIPVATVITFITVLWRDFLYSIFRICDIKLNHHCTLLDTDMTKLKMLNVLTACYTWPLH